MHNARTNVIPNEIINAISEHSPAGFILFAINESGQPEVYSCYDSDVSALALHKFSLMWSQAIQEVEESSMLDMLNNSNDNIEDLPEEE